MVLNDVLHKYSTITAYSGNGGTVHHWNRDLLKHYKDRPVIHIWVDPVSIHAYIKLG